MGRNGEEGAPWKLLAPGLGLRELKSVSEELDPELEVLGSRSSLVFERETCVLKDTSCSRGTGPLVPALLTHQELRALCLELVQGQVVQAARRNSRMSLSALIRLVN